MSTAKLASPPHAGSYNSGDQRLIDEEYLLEGAHGGASDAPAALALSPVVAGEPAADASPVKYEITRAKRWRRLAFMAVAATIVAALVIVGAVLLATRASSGGSHSGPNDAVDSAVTAASHAGQYYVAPPRYVYNLTLEPRLQWNENYGYCGSTSLVTASLYLGGLYASQYDNRNIASNGTNQKQEGSQLLLGVNDYWASHAHKLTNKLWNYNDHDVTHFLAWIKSEVLQDHVVIIGVFENPSIFGNSPPDPDYDHIVPVTGWGSNHDLTDHSYYADDVIYFSDNGLFTPNGRTSIYKCSAVVSQFAQTRKNANSASAAIYSLNGAPSSNHPNYGISITGIVDEHGDCLPMRITTSVNHESPEIKDGSNTRPAASPLTLTVTVRDLTVGESYTLYQYNDMATVPSSQFNANGGRAHSKTTFTATSQTYTKTFDIQTSDLAVFRAVRTSAP